MAEQATLGEMAREFTRPNQTGFGGVAGQIARGARGSLLMRLTAIMAEPGVVASEDKFLAAQVLLDPRRKPSAAQKATAARVLADLVADERVPNAVAIKAGKLLDDQSRWSRKRGEADD